VRKKRPLVVAAKRSTLLQDLERSSESMVLSATCEPDIYLHPVAAYVRNSVNRQPSAAQPRRGLPQRAKQATTSEKSRQLEQNSYFIRRIGGCGVGGEDDPSLNAHPNVDTGDQYGIDDPRYSLHPSTLDPTSTKTSPNILLGAAICRSQDEASTHSACRGVWLQFSLLWRRCRLRVQGLSLILFDDNFKIASIPNVRLTHLVGRLVQAGHKVGLVRQIETVTLKHASDKASGPFACQLCEVYIRGLVVADGQLGGITFFPESINAVSSASNIASSLETTSSAYKPAFEFYHRG
jgi:hypothetical protein